MTVPILTGPRVTLRPPRDSDVDERLVLGRDPEIHRMYGGSANAKPLTREDVEASLAKWMADPNAWVIEHEGRFTGNIVLHSVNQEDRRARLALGIADPGKLSQGLGSEAIRLVLAHGFGPMGLHRIDLRVLAYNTRAIRAYEKCGFRFEGRERESALIDGEWHDDMIMGILAHEFVGQQI
jgi:RimJ/RimL family protein N-acetyltransferase